MPFIETGFMGSAESGLAYSRNGLEAEETEHFIPQVPELPFPMQGILAQRAWAPRPMLEVGHHSQAALTGECFEGPTLPLKCQ